MPAGLKDYGFFRELAERALARFGACHIARFNGYMLKTAPVFLSGESQPGISHEPPGAEFARAYLRPGDQFADIGAGPGALSLIAASLVRAEGRIVAVEPHPRIYGYLRDNVALNGFQNVFTVRAAAAGAKGFLRISDFRAAGFNRVCLFGGKPADADTLDGLLWRLENKIALVNVSVNGYEAFAFAGAGETLARTDAVCFELARCALGRYGADAAAALAPLAKAGLAPCRFNGQNIEALPAGSEPPDGFYCAVRDIAACNARLAVKTAVK
ncbi:MAG: FkbM family methyltransferase [Elusimicrobiaceae bacterium]|nr:FkbM family methyltransferase [Elusimicrobiaceae bacterium]